MRPGERPYAAVPGDWANDGACKGRTRVFFPTAAGTNVSSVADSVWAAAKQVCAGCPVIGPCREFALATKEPHGVWGGLDPTQRRRILAGVSV